MVNEPSEERIDKLAKEFDLNKSNSVSEFFENPLFHGEFGHSINLGFLITVLLLIIVGILLIIYKKKKRK